ncbi:neuronal acetylcholine receptor subunit alpha-9-like isoform X1 [Corythoichthys intestinalis]|uniref:neuronal acetylcholine receptor subunit alpha-9-like isoform X1 n=1 Tax=Corythoichthys intestinalis TaxID=161448 RepID=UPI0025A4D42D|nr:neuronal acetylcholine receptor subunit alpha-9-like isoform X1 [Corythoichthys intestinalis]
MKGSEMQSLLCMLFFASVLPVSWCAHGRFAQKLLNDLFDNYTSALRPVEDTDAILNVTLQVTLSQIIDMDERNQILTAYLWIRRVWLDAHLKWSKEDYDGLDTIRIPSSYVWKPDIVLYNNADDHFTGPMDTNVVISHDGQIMWDSPAITKSSCKVDVSFFPFDAQQCRFTYGSWTYNGNQLDILNAMESADLADLVDNVEWEVLGMPATRNVILYGCCADPYPDVTYTLKLKRRASFYVFNLLIPCVMISFLAPLGFYLPADSGEKVSLGVTVMLALTVFQLLVAEIMPPSENVPLIGKYYIATMTMITASTALTIFIMNIHHCGPDAKPVPKWAKKVILQYMARMCFVYEVGENCMSPQSEKREPSMVRNRNMNGLAGARGADRNLGIEGYSSVTTEERQDSDPNNCYDSWKNGTFVDMDYDDLCDAKRCRKGGVSDGERSHGAPCNEKLLILPNVEYIANCYREQKATQKRTGEWKKVAKVLDRFFMWLFFIMVFFMSLLIMGKAI